MRPPTNGPQRYERVKRILSRALDHPTEHRRGWVVDACGEDEALRDEVLELLDQVDHLDGFLEEGARFDADDVASLERPRSNQKPTGIPERIGGMHVLRLLGFGSMGIVYLAEERHPRRRVAVKVLRADTIDAAAHKRFEREIEALGRLNHEGVARIFAAGTESAGADESSTSQYWFSMEYVEGVPLRDYARTSGASVRERIALAIRIGEIVEHAHQQGVLHRDLKPDNILITPSGDPKVLDFGVARLRETEGLSSLHTMTGAVVGTIAYMSPEQARGASVDARCDVFSLGAIVYELLTGRLPFETRGRSLHQLVRSLTEDDPIAIRTLDGTIESDLAAVVHTAIETDPHRRYPSMSAFVDDMRRWLERRPVRARPTTSLDQLRKLIVRNRRLAVAAGIVFVALTVALGVSLAGLRRVSTAEEGAREDRDTVMRLSDTLLLDELDRRADELWPIGPDLVDGLTEWLAQANDLLLRVEQHEAALADLEALDASGELTSRFAAHTSSLGGRWLLANQRSLVDRCHALAAEGGLIERIRDRRERSLRLAYETLEARASAWSEALRAISESPLYRGLIIEPQIGLVPLGASPQGLWEFAVWDEIGTVPDRDPESGELVLADDTTAVLVLLPGGSATIGFQADDPGAPHFDAHAVRHEGPPREVELDPFFLGKFEVTQHQWTSKEGSNSSYWYVGKSGEREAVTPRHPAEHMSRDQALAFASKLGCTLPTEAQWEYAARGGTTTPQYWGSDSREQLRDFANGLGLDRTGRQRDVFDLHAPVGMFPPNPYGLFDMIGNVAEMCLDDYKVAYHALPVSGGSARVVGDGGGEWTLRGANWSLDAAFQRASWRGDSMTGFRSSSHGMRLARDLRGKWRFDRGWVARER